MKEKEKEKKKEKEKGKRKTHCSYTSLTYLCSVFGIVVDVVVMV